MKKRILAWLLCAAMVAVMLPMPAAKAAEADQYGGTVDSAGVLTFEEGRTYVPLGAYAGRTDITKVIFPNSMVDIYASAFDGCENIEQVDMSSLIRTIGEKAFYDCKKLASINLPASVEDIGISAFHGCESLTSITIPQGVQDIRDYTFKWCKALTSVSIPNSVTSIGVQAFGSCESLTAVTIPNSVLDVGEAAFNWCSDLTSISFQSNNTSFGYGVFERCDKLTDVLLPGEQISISAAMFLNCASLSNISLPDSLTSINNSAFRGCSNLPNLNIPGNVESIGIRTFEGCTSFTSMTIPSRVTSVSEALFCNCTNLTSVAFLGSITNIDASAFSGCTALASIVIPASVTDMGGGVFNNCTSLVSVTIPEGVAELNSNVFNNCQSLTSVTLSEGLTTIYALAIHNCTALASIGIPNSVTSMDVYETANSWGSLEGCIGLKSITVGTGMSGKTMCFPKNADGNYETWTLATDSGVVLSPAAPAGLVTIPQAGTYHAASYTAGPSDSVCEIVGGSQYDTLDEALYLVQSGETIRLLSDIDNYSGMIPSGMEGIYYGISVDGIDITFDLNGHHLNIVNPSGAALIVKRSGSVFLTGLGEFNVNGANGVVITAPAEGKTSSVTVTNVASADSGVLLTCRGDITVRGSIVSEGQYGVLASDNSAGSVTVNGNVTTTQGGIGAYALYDKTILIKGSISASGDDSRGAYAATGGHVHVEGGVTVSGNNSYCAFATNSGSITVDGSASVTGAGCYGAYAYGSSNVAAGEDLTVSGTGGVGAFASAGGAITAEGAIMADTYVQVNSTVKAAGDYSSVEGGYLIYTETGDPNGTLVKVKIAIVTVAGTAADDTAILQIDNKTPSARDKTWELSVTSGTVKAGVSASDVTMTGLPAGLDYTAAKGAGNTIVITLTGAAATALTADAALTATIKGSAVTEADAQDSAGISLRLWYVGEGTTIVLTNEAGALIDKLITAGHEDDNLYEVLEALQPYSSGAITNRFMQTLSSNPIDREIFTPTLNTGHFDVNYPVCINADGTVATNPIYGRDYHGDEGYTTTGSNMDGVGTVWVTAAGSPADYIDAGEVEGEPITRHYKAFAVLWMPELPAVTTDAVESSGVTHSSADVSGGVTDAGTTAVTERGFVYGTSASPTTAGTKVTAALGTGAGAFSAALTGLASGTVYHVRAYAISGAGTAYGEDRTFTTQSDGGGGGSGTQTYNAEVKEGSATSETLQVTVDTASKTGTAILGAAKAATLFEAGNAYMVMPSIPGVSAYTLELPASALDAGQKSGALTLSTGFGSVAIPDNMLGSLTGTDGKTAGIAIGQGDKSNLTDAERAAVGDRPLVQLTLTLDGVQTAWNNPAAPVTVTIPYTPTAAELQNPESILIWYLDGSGKPVCIPNGHYDPVTGTVTFTATHFSPYAVGYNPVSFNDVASGAWYEKAVSFIGARGITTGTGNGNYSPNAKLTRGEFLVLLMRAYGIEPEENPTDNFSDAGDTWYTNYLAAAKRLGISTGIGDNRFAPGKEITRQEMFTLLYNALSVLGRLPGSTSGKTLTDFSDASEISPWSKDAMAFLIEAGIVTGSKGRLNPAGTATRAEAAQVLYNLLTQ